MKIAGLQKVSLLDYPDKIAATVFLAGCNLDCGYCHNRWMLSEAEVEAALSTEALLVWLGTRVGLLDGVCLSGGEPTLHEALPDLARRIKALGFAVKLDTNGTRPAMLSRLLVEGLLDYVALDIKAPLDARYHLVTGTSVDLTALRDSLGLLRGGGVTYELRTTVGPRLAEEDLVALASIMLPQEAWYLQPFWAAEGVRERGPALELAQLEALLPALQAVAPGTRLRGLAP